MLLATVLLEHVVVAAAVLLTIHSSGVDVFRLLPSRRVATVVIDFCLPFYFTISMPQVPRRKQIERMDDETASCGDRLDRSRFPRKYICFVCLKSLLLRDPLFVC